MYFKLPLSGKSVLFIPHNTLYKTGLILQFLHLEVMFEIYNIPAGYCKFQTSRWDVVKWKQNKQQNQTKQIIEQ